jgi:hypothetical protein
MIQSAEHIPNSSASNALFTIIGRLFLTIHDHRSEILQVACHVKSKLQDLV